MIDLEPGKAGMLLAAFLILGAGVTVGTPVAPGDAGWDAESQRQGPAPKVDVCHAGDDGGHILINISRNALPAHLNHGDAVAGGDGLDASCQPVPTTSLNFLAFSASFFWGGEGVTLEWTVEGTSDPVAYHVEGIFDGGAWTVAQVVAGTGSGTFTTFEFIVYDTYRIRAVLADGSEVVSPLASPF